MHTKKKLLINYHHQHKLEPKFMGTNDKKSSKILILLFFSSKLCSISKTASKNIWLQWTSFFISNIIIHCIQSNYKITQVIMIDKEWKKSARTTFNTHLECMCFFSLFARVGKIKVMVRKRADEAHLVVQVTLV